MPVVHSRVTAGTAATELFAGPVGGPGVKGVVGLVRVPVGGSSVYLGASDVTAATGFELSAGGAISIDVDPGEALYGCTAAGSQSVHLLGATSND